MKKRTALVLMIVMVFFSLSSTTLLAQGRQGMENYRLAVDSLERRDWEQAKHHLDKVIMDELSHSEYFGKAVYLKSVLLAAEIERDIELKNNFEAGEERQAITDQEARDDFLRRAEIYERSALQKTDTVLGLANYLMANLPPVQINLEYLYRGRGYDQRVISQIESGEMPEEDRLDKLEEDLLAQKVNRYLEQTLTVKDFNNLSVIRAREGDNIYDLANAYEIPFYLMLSANDHITDPNTIHPGEKIYVPKVSTSRIDYPAYFYHLSRMAYEVNPQRRENIKNLLAKAYQLTSEEELTEEEIREESKTLAEQLEIEEYAEKVDEQEEIIRAQEEELQDLRDRYNELWQEIEGLVAEEDSEEEEEVEEGLVSIGDYEAEDYDPEEDPLDY